MEPGDTIECMFHTIGGKVTLTLDDRVYPDRSCGQYEAGWWVYDPARKTHNDYFVSEAGIVYDWNPKSERYDRGVGKCPAWAKRYEEMEKAYE